MFIGQIDSESIEFAFGRGRGKDKKKRKRRGMGFNPGKSLSKGAGRLKKAANSFSRKAAAKGGVQGAAQNLGGRVQLSAAKNAKKAPMKDRAALAARGAKNTAVGAVKAAPTVAGIKVAQGAAKAEKFGKRMQKKRNR